MNKQKFQDTMISAKNFDSMVKFYTRFVGLEEVQRTPAFVLLKDKETGQSLCITDGHSVASTSPGIAVPELDDALKDLESMGGKVRKRWEFSSMKGANCEDPEGNELMIWQGQH